MGRDWSPLNTGTHLLSLIPRKGCNSDLLPNYFSGILGYCRLQAGGSTILMRLDIKLYAGLLSRESIGVFG